MTDSSETIDVDLRSFVDFAERDVRFADRNFPPPEPGVCTIARKLCDLAFEARDLGRLGTAFLMILLARTLVCATREESEDLLALVTAFDCSQEALASWAGREGTTHDRETC